MEEDFYFVKDKERQSELRFSNHQQRISKHNLQSFESSNSTRLRSSKHNNTLGSKRHFYERSLQDDKIPIDVCSFSIVSNNIYLYLYYYSLKRFN